MVVDMDTVLTNLNNIDVAVNELISNMSINRNVEKLLENDKLLEQMYLSVLGALQIDEWKSNAETNKPYNYGDLVWFKDIDGKLWLFRCIQDNNVNSPQLAIDDKNSYVYENPNFQKYGWDDQNEYIDIINMGLRSKLVRKIKNQLAKHENDDAYHRFGKISAYGTENNISSKVLLADFSNTNGNRNIFFFPGQTIHFTTKNILNGTCRIYDNGLIEFDIVFKLGYKSTIDNDYDVLSCNDVQFYPSTTTAGSEYQENSKYFNTFDDMTIFTNQHKFKTGQAEFSNSIQGNRNKYVNTYFAELDLFSQNINFYGRPILNFTDGNGTASLDYMIFCNGQTIAQCSDIKNKKLVSGINQMTWCNKTSKSITAVYITYPNSVTDDFVENSGLAANSFSCQIIGKWK